MPTADEVQGRAEHYGHEGAAKGKEGVHKAEKEFDKQGCNGKKVCIFIMMFFLPPFSIHLTTGKCDKRCGPAPILLPSRSRSMTKS